MMFVPNLTQQVKFLWPRLKPEDMHVQTWFCDIMNILEANVCLIEVWYDNNLPVHIQ